jgi:hypothetical protein
MNKMCDSYNDIDCPITISTIGTPDATFVSGKVGEDLQFRGIQLSGGAIGILTPTTLLINTTTPANSIPVDGVIGTFDRIEYSSLNPLVFANEQLLTLASSSYNTGIFALSTLTIPVATYYKVSLSLSTTTTSFVNGASITFRMRNSIGTVFAEYYSRSIGNDEYTSTFTHVMLLPVDTYSFSIQVGDLTSSEYLRFVFLESDFSIKRVSL